MIEILKRKQIYSKTEISCRMTIKKITIGQTINLLLMMTIIMNMSSKEIEGTVVASFQTNSS